MIDNNSYDSDDNEQSYERNHKVGVAVANFDIAAWPFRIHELLDFLLALFETLFALFTWVNSRPFVVGTGSHLLHPSARLAVIVFRFLIGSRASGNFFRLHRFSSLNGCASDGRFAAIPALFALWLARSRGRSGHVGALCLLLLFVLIVRCMLCVRFLRA